MTTGWMLPFTSRSGTQTLCDLSEVLNLSKPHGDFVSVQGKPGTHSFRIFLP